MWGKCSHVFEYDAYVIFDKVPHPPDPVPKWSLDKSEIGRHTEKFDRNAGDRIDFTKFNDP